MVDGSGKNVTARTAAAAARLLSTADVITLLRRDGLPKDDALAIARVAGIAGARQTSQLIPLCHPIGLREVIVALTLVEASILSTATNRIAERTGVEMGVMTGLTVAGLALYDMIKGVDCGASLTDVRVEAKSCGRSGSWRRSAVAGPHAGRQ